jgi:hypothetical protein
MRLPSSSVSRSMSVLVMLSKSTPQSAASASTVVAWHRTSWRASSSGRMQVLENWSAVFAGVPDFRAELLASCRDGNVEWGEVDWRGHHTDGSAFAMRGVIIATIRDDRIAAGRLYIEPVEHSGADIDAAVEQLYQPPSDDD